jgi:putative DNA primase/helicase
MNSPNPVFIPKTLKTLDQWLIWKLERRDGKPSKVPYDARTGRYEKSNDPTTWCGFDTVVKAVGANGYSGIGFAFREGDGLAGVDVDYPWGSPVTTEIRERFKGTYCERSPSDKLRIFCFGKPRRCGKGTGDKSVELYDYTSPRYLTVTGEWVEGTVREVTDQQAALDWLHERYFRPKEEPKPKKPKDSGPELTLGDQEIIDKAKAARNGGKFSSLFYGGWQAEGYASQSEADAALCSMLAFWTQDERQVDRIFRQSALMREKWDERHHADGRTYGQATIERALSTVAETYRPGDHREEPPPWGTDPPIEAYADDPECRGQGRDSGSKSGEGGEGAPSEGKKQEGETINPPCHRALTLPHCGE